MYQSYLDKSTPFATYRWVGTVVLLLVFFLRIFLVQGWYIGMSLPLFLQPFSLHTPISIPITSTPTAPFHAIDAHHSR